jgi:hypothetical protein
MAAAISEINRSAGRPCAGRQPRTPGFRSAEVEDDDAPLGRLAIFALRFDRAVHVDGQLQPRLILLLSAALLFFAATNLLDDERRQHLISFPGKPTHEDD